MKKRINKILWYGSELENGKAKVPSVSVEENGLDGLNEGELYISNNEIDPALFIRTSNSKVVRLGEANYKPFKFEYDESIDALVLSRTDGKPAHFLATGALSTRGLGEIEEGGGGTGTGVDLLNVPSDIIPIVGGSYSLGSSANAWKMIYANGGIIGNTYIDSFRVIFGTYIQGQSWVINPDGSASFSSLTINGASAATQSWVNSQEFVKTSDLISVASDIIPDGNLTRKLGSSSNRWSLLYVNSINAGTIAPRTDNGWDLGMTTFRWRNLYAVDGHLDSLTIGGETAATQSYVTSQLGSYATTSALSNYVTLNSAQTISGKKTFTGGITVDKGITASHLYSVEYLDSSELTINAEEVNFTYYGDDANLSVGLLNGYKPLTLGNTSFSPALTSGTVIGTITIGGESKTIYAPNGGNVTSGGKINLVTVSAATISSYMASVGDDGIKMFIVTDSNGNIPSLNGETSITVSGTAKLLLFGKSKPFGVSVGDILAVTKLQCRIIPLNDAKAANGDFPGADGLETVWDKTQINKIAGIEYTANAALPRTSLLPSSGVSNMNDALETGIYVWCTLGRPSGATGAFTCVVHRSSTPDFNNFYTIEQTAYGREAELGQVYKRIIFWRSDEQQYGEWVRVDNTNSADLSNYVTLDGEQTITGSKYFNDLNANSIYLQGFELKPYNPDGGIPDRLMYDGYVLLDEYNYGEYLDSAYVKKSGDTVTGQLGFSGNTYPNIYGNGNFLVLSAASDGLYGLTLDKQSAAIRARANNNTQLGTPSVRWANVYSVLGNFSGQITSSVADGTAPFVVASKTEVANLHSATATKLHTARTIAISGAVTGTATTFDGSSNISINTTSVDANYVGGYFGCTYGKKVYYGHHPENLSGTIPFLYNDLAHLVARGGSCTMYTTTDTDYTQPTLTNTRTIGSDYTKLFDGSPSYFQYSVSSSTDVVVVDITLPKAFSYTTPFYIDFGTTNWGAKDVSVYVWNNSTNNSEQVYTLKGSITNYNKSAFHISDVSYSYTDTSGTKIQGFNRLRVVLTNFVGTSPRIAQIGLIQYSSLGLRNGYMSRGIDDQLYRSLTPAKNLTYNLGNGNNRWLNIYGANADFTDSVTTQSIIGVSSKALVISSINADLALRRNNTDATSVVLNGSAFKPYNAANGLLDLGASSARWKGIYGQTLDVTGVATFGNDILYNSGDATLKIYDIDVDSDNFGNKAVAIQTCFDHTDPETSDYITRYEGRCNLLLQPRGGQVYVGYTPTSLQSPYALSVGQAVRLYGDANSTNAPEISFYRDGKSSWRIKNDSGGLYFQNNYTTAVQSSYFNVLVLSLNTGHASLKGSLTTGGNILPSAHEGGNIGATDKRWVTGYFSSIVNVGGANSSPTSGARNTYIGAGVIELSHDTPFIDFHCGNSTSDYTSRIIEGVSGQITVLGKLKVGGVYTVATDYNFHVAGTAYASTSLTTPTGNITTLNATTINAETINGVGITGATTDGINQLTIDGEIHSDYLCWFDEIEVATGIGSDKWSIYDGEAAFTSLALSTALSISNGGTGATTAESARANLGLDDTYLTLSGGTLTGNILPSVTKTLNLGRADKRWNVYAASLSAVSVVNDLVPDLSNQRSLGSTDLPWWIGYINYLSPKEIWFNDDEAYSMRVDGGKLCIQTDNLLIGTTSDTISNVANRNIYINGRTNIGFGDAVDNLPFERVLSVAGQSNMYGIVCGGEFNNFGDDMGAEYANWWIMPDGVGFFQSVENLSDATKKSVIGNVQLSISDIAAAPSIYFTWMEARRNKKARYVGTTAQYWNDLLPELVSDNNGVLSLDYATLGVTLGINIAREVNTMKMWQTSTTDRIEELEDKVKKLEEENKELRELLNNNN